MTATAAELWRVWESSEALRPQDYDADIVDQVRAVLVRGGHSGSGALTDELDHARWAARDLIHALAPVVASFAGMQRDLLRLLERIGASSGTEDNLRVQYEFIEGDPIDESLADFRETVQQIESVLLQLRPLSFDNRHAFAPVLHRYASDEWIEEFVAITATDRRTWQFATGVTDTVRTGDPRVDARADRVITLVRDVLTMLATVSDDTRSLRTPRSSPENTPDADLLGEIVQAATDFWPLTTASAVHRWADGIADGTLTASDRDLAAVDTWLDGFEAGDPQQVSIERTVDALTDILSLPTWGKRHELYSAWIATQLDRAVDSRFEFVVREGALRFPFRETLLAHLDTADGPVDLWCEMRSAATGTLSGGRKANIQPDYRLCRPPAGAASAGSTLAAVEVKQYKAAAASRHGATLRDYVVNLPGATVFMVGHGPLGGRVAEAVPAADRSRARVHPEVRVGRPRESADFRAAFAQLFPKPAATWPSRIELTWSSTADLDLYVCDGNQTTSYQQPSSTHSSLRRDVRSGGTEVIDLHPEAHGPLEVWVQVFSGGSLRTAAPVLTFFAEDEPLLELSPSHEPTGTNRSRWDVGRIHDDGRIAPSDQSRVRGGAGAR